MSDSRVLVYISGAPASGKSSLAVPLAAELGYALLAKDRITHPVHVVTTLGLEAVAEYDRPVGIGALVTVDTTAPVDVNAVATTVRACHDRHLLRRW